MQEDTLSMEAMLLSRAYLYTAFHKAFGGAPTPELLEALSSETAVDIVDEYSSGDATMGALRDFLRGLGGSIDPDFIWNAEAEYTRLLIGPGALPAIPWESPYASGDASMFQEGTLAVRSIYRSQGYEPARMFHVPDDHVALMGAFMAKLAECSLDLFWEGDWDGLYRSMLVQCAFVRDHMAGWLPEFAKGACTMRTAHLYPQLAKGIAAFVELDMVFTAEAAVWADEQRAAAGGPGTSEVLEGARRALEQIRGVRLFGLEDFELRAVPKGE